MVLLVVTAYDRELILLVCMLDAAVKYVNKELAIEQKNKCTDRV